MPILEYPNPAAFARHDEIRRTARAKLGAAAPVARARTDPKADLREAPRTVLPADAVLLPES